MGIRMTNASDDPGLGAFSQDILKIEISGPEVKASLHLRRGFS